MPTAYIQQLAKTHHISTSKSEKRWNLAKKQASKQGHPEEYGYITNIYKKMMGESVNDLSLSQFLIITEFDDVEDMSYGKSNNPDDDFEDLESDEDLEDEDLDNEDLDNEDLDNEDLESDEDLDNDPKNLEDESGEGESRLDRVISYDKEGQSSSSRKYN
jgi:hypothetical protein